MKVTPLLTAAIDKRLAELTAGTDPREAEQRALAASLRALPVYADMGGCIALRRDGELLLIHSNQNWSGPVEWTVEIEPQWRQLALQCAVAKYLELAWLLEE